RVARSSTPGPHRIRNRVPEALLKFIPKRIHQRLLGRTLQLRSGAGSAGRRRVWPASPGVETPGYCRPCLRDGAQEPLKSIAGDVAEAVTSEHRPSTLNAKIKVYDHSNFPRAC